MARHEDILPAGCPPTEGGPEHAPPAAHPRQARALKEAVARVDGVPPAWFDELADAAIRRSVLVVAGVRLSILEVELYLHRADHADPYVHRSAAQLGSCGSWYFHREKAARLGFTLKGLDLTFGAVGTEAGGLLIRAVAGETGPGGYVEGPSKVVDAILTAAGVSSVLELKALGPYEDDAFSLTGLVRLEGRLAPTGEAIHAGPRIGLKPGKAYAAAPYRYRARAALTKKDKSGLLAGRRVPPWLDPDPAPRQDDAPPPDPGPTQRQDDAPLTPALTVTELYELLGF